MTWLLIILCGVITFLIRFIPLSGIISSDLPLFVKQSFKYIPLAVLTPIIVSDLSIIENKSFFARMVPKSLTRSSSIKNFY